MCVCMHVRMYVCRNIYMCVYVCVTKRQKSTAENMWVRLKNRNISHLRKVQSKDRDCKRKIKRDAD